MTVIDWLVVQALASMVHDRQARWWLHWRFYAEHPDLYGPHPTA